MTSIKIVALIILMPFLASGQKKSIDKLLKTYNTESVPYISVQELKMKAHSYVILDTRKKEEYEVSHLPKAIWVGENFNALNLDQFLKSKKEVVVYCTVGIRSEDFGEKMERSVSKKIHNLYGGIFAWKDAGYELLDSKNQPTDRVHTFSKNWQDYLKTGVAVY